MFDLGMQELIVIFIVALLVVGPKKLPELARSLGKGIAELKKTLQGVKEQIDSEVEEVQKPVKEEMLNTEKLLNTLDRPDFTGKADKKEGPGSPPATEGIVNKEAEGTPDHQEGGEAGGKTS